MIPEDKVPAVTRALKDAFGGSSYEEIYPTTGGQSSAQVFRIVVRGKPYLLKIMRTEILGDPANEFACMKTAAAAGIAPKVWYANVNDRVLLTDYVESKTYPDDLHLQIAPMLRTLHSLPHFQKPVMGNYLETMDGFVRRFQNLHVLTESASTEIFEGYAQAYTVYPRGDAELTASHNDLKPQNIRFDGARVWLVDWESAFLNDQYVDIALVANFFVKSDSEEDLFLDAYFGEAAGEYRRARFFLMRQIMHVISASFFTLLVARKAPPPALDLATAQDFADFHRRLITEEIDTLQVDAQIEYAKVHLNRALFDMRTRRFKDAVAIVDGSASA